jgi:hypothetical protein
MKKKKKKKMKRKKRRREEQKERKNKKKKKRTDMKKRTSLDCRVQDAEGLPGCDSQFLTLIPGNPVPPKRSPHRCQVWGDSTCMT